ncbi:hypothetical protein BO221_14150 [Archangium sp. Cb G35]|uniref:hypothetical protein n=1 Tax=Archangium sp. Cb G35 TaxID=1920190 RepID=UPI000936B255|nr:hypothetical protein [Archangium sp. Cb G35]OJT24313.1 hypothetical protein BO221_14150 [Archangium sp. Cb G35]
MALSREPLPRPLALQKLEDAVALRDIEALLEAIADLMRTAPEEDREAFKVSLTEDFWQRMDAALLKLIGQVRRV